MYCRQCDSLSQSQSQVLEDHDRMSLGGGYRRSPSKKRKKEAKREERIPTLEAALLLFADALALVTKEAVCLAGISGASSSLEAVSESAKKVSMSILLKYLRSWRTYCAEKYPDEKFHLIETFLTSKHIYKFSMSIPMYEKSLRMLLDPKKKHAGRFPYGESPLFRIVPSLSLIYTIVDLTLRHFGFGSSPQVRRSDVQIQSIVVYPNLFFNPVVHTP